MNWPCMPGRAEHVACVSGEGCRAAAIAASDMFRTLQTKCDLLAASWKRAEDELAAITAERDRLRAALRFQDPRNAAERYDRIADDFYRETGWWAPGRSIPAAFNHAYSEAEDDERHRKWREFCNRWHERFFDEALAS